MRFRTELKINKLPFSLNPMKPVLTLGSCFADNIAARMRSCGWEAANPPGTLFNPASVATVMRMIVEDDERTFRDSIFLKPDEGLHLSRLFGSSVCGESAEELFKCYQTLSTDVKSILEQGDTVFITFGTAWIYSLVTRDKKVDENKDVGNKDARNMVDEYKDEENKDAEYIVGNCHKLPQINFKRRRLSVREIVKTWKKLLSDMSQRYPHLRFIFTVSPVRHLKDGFHENTISKSILHLAIEELTEAFDNVFYFPAYELVNDDLRDYRFYADDLVHPSTAAIEYIWENLKESMMDERGTEVIRQGEKRIKAENHIPIRKRSSSNQQLKKTLEVV